MNPSYCVVHRDDTYGNEIGSESNISLSDAFNLIDKIATAYGDHYTERVDHVTLRVWTIGQIHRFSIETQ